MLQTNPSQIRVPVHTEVVTGFFMSVPSELVFDKVSIGDSCFIYDDAGKASQATCQAVDTHFIQYKTIDGQIHKVPKVEVDLNTFEFSRLIGAMSARAEQDSGYNSFVIKRALAVKAISVSQSGGYELTEYGHSLAAMHFMPSSTLQKEN